MYSQFPACGNESLAHERGDAELDSSVMGNSNLKQSKEPHRKESQEIPGLPDTVMNEKTCQSAHFLSQSIESIKIAKSQCTTLTENEFHDYIKNNSVVEAYMRRWDATPAYMPKICGISTEVNSCTCSSQIVRDAAGKSWPKPYLISPGLPFNVGHSLIFGEVYTTPFFSVIPSNVSAVPPPIFSLRKLSLSRIVNCHVFRHELAFNPRLLIDPPQNMLECIDSNKVWYVLRNEICDYLKTPETPSSFPVLAEMFMGIKALMISILPVELAPHVVEFYDPANLVSGGASGPSYSVEEIIRFTEGVIETVVLPDRKPWAACMKESFSKGFESLAQLVRGFKIAISLLNLTKIDHINNRIKERCDFLRQNTGRLEKVYYQNKINSGVLQVSDFSNWLSKQPSTEIFRGHPNTLVAELRTKSDMIDHLVGGFMSSYLYHDQDPKKLGLFSQDSSRIRSLKERVESLVYTQLEEYIINCVKSGQCSYEESNALLESSGLRESKIYQQIKLKSLNHIAERALAIMLNFALYVPYGTAYTQALADPSASRFSTIVYEVSMILLLHWIGASDYYFMQEDSL